MLRLDDPDPSVESTCSQLVVARYRYGGRRGPDAAAECLVEVVPQLVHFAAHVICDSDLWRARVSSKSFLGSSTAGRRIFAPDNGAPGPAPEWGAERGGLCQGLGEKLYSEQLTIRPPRRTSV